MNVFSNQVHRIVEGWRGLAEHVGEYGAHGVHYAGGHREQGLRCRDVHRGQGGH